MSDEVRVTSATGGQKGQKGARFGGGDPLAMMELARVYGMGEEKYDRYNYLKGYPWSLSVDALFRHLFAFLSGEDRDEESGLLHTAHVAWHALTLTSFAMRDIGEDDRPPALETWDEAGCIDISGLINAMNDMPPPTVTFNGEDISMRKLTFESYDDEGQWYKVVSDGEGGLTWELAAPPEPES